MDGKIKKAFDSIISAQELNESTLSYVMAESSAKRRSHTVLTKRLVFAAAAIFAFIVIFGLNIYSRETAYISLDINPSIAFSINDYGLVINASAYNSEAAAIIDGLQIKNKPYREAVDMVLHSQKMQLYLNDYTNMWVAVQANDPDKEAEIEQTVQSAIDTTLQKHHSDISVEYCEITEETRIAAEAQGVSASKYQAISELQELDPTATVEHYRHNSIHEINKVIESHHAGKKGSHGANGGGQESGDVPSVNEQNVTDKGGGQSHGAGNEHRSGKGHE